VGSRIDFVSVLASACQPATLRHTMSQLASRKVYVLLYQVGDRSEYWAVFSSREAAERSYKKLCKLDPSLEEDRFEVEEDWVDGYQSVGTSSGVRRRTTLTGMGKVGRS